MSSRTHNKFHAAAEDSASTQRHSARRESSGRSGILATLEHNVLHEPARFVSARLGFIVISVALTLFGLMMIYSASSITAMLDDTTGNNPMYYLIKQGMYVAIGTVAAIIIAHFDYHAYLRAPILPAVWIAVIAMLVLIFSPAASHDAYGATRWIAIAGFTLQPSEFFKIVAILVAANLASRLLSQRSITLSNMLVMFGFSIVLPLLLVLLQPDKGSTLIIAATLLLIAYLAGLDGKIVVGTCVFGMVVMIALSMKDEYSRARILTLIDPFRDEFGASYQLIQGFYAFASGGLFGMGIGNSHQKYSYLPFAHNDFIFAVIGEELGLVGTLGVLAAFACLVYFGFQIAKQAPDLSGRLVAAGCSAMLAIQMLVNVAGVVGGMPLSGKPIPFLSYGGSSILSTLIAVGLVLSVSKHSQLPETHHDRARRSIAVAEADEEIVIDPETQVSQPLRRSSRSARSLKVYEGAKPRTYESQHTRSSARSSRGDREHMRITTDKTGRRRINLGQTPAERLRHNSSSPHVNLPSKGIDNE